MNIIFYCLILAGVQGLASQEYTTGSFYQSSFTSLDCSGEPYDSFGNILTGCQDSKTASFSYISCTADEDRPGILVTQEQYSFSDNCTGPIQPLTFYVPYCTVFDEHSISSTCTGNTEPWTELKNVEFHTE